MKQPHTQKGDNIMNGYNMTRKMIIEAIRKNFYHIMGFMPLSKDIVINELIFEGWNKSKIYGVDFNCGHVNYIYRIEENKIFSVSNIDL